MRWVAVALLAAAAAGFWPVMQQWRAARDAQLRRDVQLSAAKRDWPAAAFLAAGYLARHPDDGFVRLILARSLSAQGEFARAFAEYERLAKAGASAFAVTHAAEAERMRREAQAGAAETACRLGRTHDAEKRFLEILRDDPDNAVVRRQLAEVYCWQGRRYEAEPHLFELVRRGQAGRLHLILLANLESTLNEPEQRARALEAEPDHQAVRLGEARVMIAEERLDEARELLEEVVREQPDLIEAQARLGLLLAGLTEDAERRRFWEWERRLPAEAERHPLIWQARGMAEEAAGEIEAAAGCYWESVRRDPNSRQSNYKLARLLTQLGREADAAPFAARVALLTTLETSVNELTTQPQAVAEYGVIPRTCETLGRLWEAAAWWREISAANPADRTAAAAVARLRALIAPETTRTLAEAQPARRLDLAGWSARRRREITESPAPVRPPPGQDPQQAFAAGPIRFAWRTDCGVEFQFFESPDETTRGARMFEFTGGGVGVLDFDRDGWPDLYFTQGAEFPERAGKPDGSAGRFRDKLFRNRGAAQFVDATEPCGIVDEEFSQGVACGDYNEDGFPDLLVGGLSGIRLYENQGDGTFHDATAAAGLNSRDWTVSAAIVDVNADGLPDLFECNYVGGAEVFERICNGVVCSPTVFEAAPDRLWLNRGDGTFTDVSAAAALRAPHGTGLGVVAADFERTGTIGFFVANDQRPNFYFKNVSANGDGIPHFVEAGLTAGLALDREGQEQACMGVAVDDVDGNGLLDLFVSNFYRESNTLYLQVAPGQFRDETRAKGLRQPSFDLLGFGTQFLDADLDGWPDLVLANGMVDDYRDKGVPWEMRPQGFRNRGDGSFEELPRAQLGKYFERDWIGRGLAKGDFDRDGAEDFAVSHLQGPAAVVCNATEPRGRGVTLHLRGTAGSRDAVGAVVEVAAEGRIRVGQLTAGSGYMASNEPILAFGLGGARRIERLTIRWPGGAVQEWTDLPVDSCWLAVEGGRLLAR